MKKTFALFLALVLAVSVVAGCSGRGNNSGKTNSTSQEEDLKALIGKYPIAEPGTLTLKIWSTMGDTIANDIKDFNDIVAFQEMETRTGIHIDWTHAVSGQDDEAFNLMIATRELPDLIRNNIGSQGKKPSSTLWTMSLSI